VGDFVSIQPRKKENTGQNINFLSKMKYVVHLFLELGDEI